ncbi:Alpha-mannosidase [Streptococcus sp. DD11]|nr:Alpha-mannosidase [Streptococcus sp. DD11]
MGDDTIAVTILRATGELGDWGYFPTPEAQCLRDFQVEYTIECHQPADRFAAYRRAKAFQTPLTALQIAKQKGQVPASGKTLEHPALSLATICPTAYKAAEDGDGQVLRYYNMSQETVRVTKQPQTALDLLEEPRAEDSGLLSPQEIRTERLRERE